MRTTHQLVIYRDHICALGNGKYFSWIIEPAFDKWDLATIYGKRQGTFPNLRAALDHIGYEIGSDPADEKDYSSIIVINKETFEILYWNTIPDEEKHKIPVGDSHNDTYLQSLSTSE